MSIGERQPGGAARVLIIEDDEAICRVVAALVTHVGAIGIRSSNGRDGIRAFFEQRPDLVILDVGLPILDGWQVLDRIREVSDVPVLILTALDREQDKVRGLKSGANDYLVKPFGVRELEARIEALLRRPRRDVGTEDAQELGYVDGDLHVDWLAREVTILGKIIYLTALEFRLLEAFIRHTNHALSHRQLLDLAWDDPVGVGPDRVKFTVLRLRRKLGWNDSHSYPIQAIRGHGYRYRPTPRPSKDTA